MLVSRLIKTSSFVRDVYKRFHGKKYITRSDSEWLKCRLQDMGPTYIKIGQFVSARRDIFDKHIVDSLKDLQDKVMPLEDKEVKVIIEPVRHLYDKIELKPIASASIGQVHKARLRQGKRNVVIKIKRRNIEKQIIEDVHLLNTILDGMQLLGVLNVTETKELLEDFKESVLKEADYRNEVENMTMFAAKHIDMKELVLPSPLKPYCNQDVIVMNYIASNKISDIKTKLNRDERKQLAYKLMDIFVMHFINEGVMHGDPHEGNMGVDSKGNIVMYDFGSIITIDAELRSLMKQLVFELMTENIDAAMDVIKKINLIHVRDEVALRKYLEKYIEYFKTVDIKVFKFSDQENFRTLPVKLDGMIFKLIRAFGIVEGICKDLDPGFNYNEVFVKYMDMLLLDQEFMRYKMMSDVRWILKSILKALD